jgi:hypothetical protein
MVWDRWCHLQLNSWLHLEEVGLFEAGGVVAEEDLVAGVVVTVMVVALEEASAAVLMPSLRKTCEPSALDLVLGVLSGVLARVGTFFAFEGLSLMFGACPQVSRHRMDVLGW